MKKILITGAKSYIGVSFLNYVEKWYNSDFQIDTIDMIDGSWRNKDFSLYDIVYHVAGIAHADIGNVSEETKEKYYSVNTDLAVETAKKAKDSGVKQFIFMSSSIIYGDSAPFGKEKIITKDTEPNPSNFYGDSKYQADLAIQKLSDEFFHVCILRPPMVYGKGSRGNYSTLSKLARVLPVFPDCDNHRSMIYIENLCEFIVQIMLRYEHGVFFPQNSEYTRTSSMVKLIAKTNNHRIFVSRIWNWIVWLAYLIPGKTRTLANKAFGSLAYDHNLSIYDFEYQKYSLEESIKRTETK